MIACPNRSSCRTSFPKNFGVANGFRPEGDRTAAVMVSDFSVLQSHSICSMKNQKGVWCAWCLF